MFIFGAYFEVVEPEPNQRRPVSMAKEPCENDFDGIIKFFFKYKFNNFKCIFFFSKIIDKILQS